MVRGIQNWRFSEPKVKKRWLRDPAYVEFGEEEVGTEQSSLLDPIYSPF